MKQMIVVVSDITGHIITICESLEDLYNLMSHWEYMWQDKTIWRNVPEDQKSFDGECFTIGTNSFHYELVNVHVPI